MKPVGPMPNWIDFICSGCNPFIVTAKNQSGGIAKGCHYQSFGTDESGLYYAIWNSAGNAVWCAKANFEE